MKYFTKAQVRYGSILCALIVLCLASMEITGNNQSFDKSPLTALFMFVAPIFVLYLAISAKKKSQKKKLKFKEGVMEGFKISLFFGIVSPFIFLFYYIIVNPAMIEYVKKVYNLGNADASLAVGVDMLVQFFTSIISGTIVSAIISLFLKTKK